MSYIPNTKDFDILYQQNTSVYIRILLLNKDLVVVDNLDGELLSDSYNIEAESDIRRTFDLTLFVKDSSFLISKDTKIWLDKYISIMVGYKYNRTGELKYYKMGTFLFNEIGYQYDNSTKELTLSCVDLMSNFTGLRNGQVMGLTTEIPEGSDIRNAIIDTLTNLGNYNKYRIDSRVSTDINNLFNINASANVFKNCSVSDDVLNINIQSGQKEAYIEYYTILNIKKDTFYTLNFNSDKTNSSVYILIKINGIKNNEDFSQEVKGNKGENIVSFKIDKDFENIKNIVIGFATFDNNTVYSATYSNIVLYEGNFTLENIPKYVKYDTNQIVPYDLKFSAGSTVYDILNTLNEINAGWEMFFDIDNTFINQKIPTTIEDRYILDWNILNDFTISESLSTNFSDVKNSTRVWGKCIDADRVIEECTNKENVYEVTIDYLIPEGNDDIPFGTTIAIKININNLEDMKIKITDNKAAPTQAENDQIQYKKMDFTYPIVNDMDTPIEKDKLKKDTYYVFKYRSKKFYYVGQFQILYVVKEYNKLPLKEGQSKDEWIAEDKIKEGTENIKYIINSETPSARAMALAETESSFNPFAIDEIGEIRQVLSGGDYDLIYTDDLARQRAEYENWKSMRLNTNLTLELKTIPWLDVNQKIQYKSNVTNNIEEYIIKSINGSIMENIMTIEAVQFYPLYPFITE